MMVSAKGRYALRILIELARYDGEGFLSLKTIADRQKAPIKYLEAIVAQLNRAGMVESLRGKEGGYRLTRRPEEYHIFEILRLTEESMAPVACLGKGEVPDCDHADGCLTLPMWQKLDSLIEDYLSTVTLKDLIDGTV
ncbi:MAG: Rrf2 family transcriptional regulator [Clostridia bacterium]|nr:Rrf2 family transcriptional regulator [Clostridia bacterium]